MELLSPHKMAEIGPVHSNERLPDPRIGIAVTQGSRNRPSSRARFSYFDTRAKGLKPFRNDNLKITCIYIDETLSEEKNVRLHSKCTPFQLDTY